MFKKDFEQYDRFSQELFKGHSIPITLTSGTYFLCWLQEGADGMHLYNPAVTIDGVVETGDALAYEYETWVPVVDGEYKGFPFIIEGTTSSAL